MPYPARRPASDALATHAPALHRFRGARPVDAGGFRDKQIGLLRASGQKMEEKALHTKQIVELQPMTPHDRRIVHMVISGIPGLSSHSEGEGNQSRSPAVRAAQRSRCSDLRPSHAHPEAPPP
jgi:hypothetical protein